jgi:RHS repeat-associated protein
MTRYAYDPRTFRLLRLRSEHYTLASGLTYRPTGDALQDYGYGYDLAGNILTIRDRTPGSGIRGNPQALGTTDPQLRQLLGSGDALDRQFTYDPLYQLLTATGREYQAAPPGDPWADTPRGTDLTQAQSYTETYDYDPAGNILTLKHLSTGGFTRAFTVAGGSNRMQRMTAGNTPYDYAFDANGNVTAETTSRHFAWNHADQLKAFAIQTQGAQPSVHAQYLYDAAGQRVKKLVRRQGGAVEVTHYLGQVFEHHRWPGPATGQNNHLHVMDDHQRVALVRAGPAHPDDRGPATAFQLGDHLGSSTAVIDETGTLINREEYTPYGETSFGSFTKKRYRFTGKERDEESGMGYYGARYLLPALCRWASCDPVGPAQSLNLYCSCLNAPTQFVDPAGKQATEPGGFASIDTDGSGKLDAREVYNKWSCTKPEAATNLLASIPRSKFTQDGWVVREAVLSINLAPTLDPARAYELNENTQRWDENGNIYTNREGREATERNLNRYRDPARLFRTVDFGAEVVIPEVYLPLRSIYHSATGHPGQAALDLAPVLGGRVFTMATGSTKPSLLKLATGAGAGEEIEGQLEVFAHGTIAPAAKEMIESQGGSLSPTGGNFGGRFFTVPDVGVADVFAARSAQRAGEEAAVVGVALPRTFTDQLREAKLLTLGPIDNPPPGVSPGTQQWVFEPGALLDLANKGFFFLIK